MPKSFKELGLLDPFTDEEEAGGPDRARIRFQPEDREVAAENGQTLLGVARLEGVKLPHACGGRARCGTCYVTVLAGEEALSPMEAVERRTLRQYDILAPEFRLACQARVLGDCEIRVEMTPEKALAPYDGEGASFWKPRGWK
jgi:adenylate cyclase